MSKNHNFLNNVRLKLMEMDTVLFLTFIREALTRLPGVTEKPCFGTPAFYVNKKIFARLKEDCETLVIQTFERGKWMEENPEIFFVTDHYLNYDYMLIALKNVSPEDLTSLLITAWYNRAPKKLIREYEDGRGV